MDELTPQRVIISIVIMIVIAIIIWIISIQIKKLIGKMKNTTQIADLAAQGIVPSYSDNEFYAMCNKLYDAMDGPGTDVQGVLSVYKQILNDADFAKLNSTFGIKGSSWFGLEKGDLNSWLTKEGNNLVYQVNQILAQNGVTKRYF